MRKTLRAPLCASSLLIFSSTLAIAKIKLNAQGQRHKAGLLLAQLTANQAVYKEKICHLIPIKTSPPL